MAVPVAAVVAVASAAEHQVEGAVKTLYEFTNNSTEQGFSEMQNTTDKGVEDANRIAKAWGKTREVTEEITY